MKAGRVLGCLFWALLYCVLYLDLVNASEDELLDFDFADANDPSSFSSSDTAAGLDDWQLEEDEQQTQQAEKKLEDNMLDFSVDLDEPEPEKQLPPFDWREKVLRSALAKALTDRVLRQRFAEVMPILRVLSSQQRLALSALISAQMNAKQGHELRLDQVRMMFGDDKKLLLPIVFDLANLVKNSARKYIKLDNELTKAAQQQASTLQARKDELTVEESQQDDSVGTIDVNEAKPQEEEQAAGASLEDFFDEVQSDILDPQMINEALQSNNTPPADAPKPTARQSSNQHKRARRSPIEFVHKLTRSVPLSVSEQQLLGGAAGRTIKLNTTAFQQPSGAAVQSATNIAQQTTITSTVATPSSTQSYEEIEDLAFAGLNGTELPLNADARTYELTGNNNSSVEEEPLPSPEELIAGPRYRLNGSNNKRYGQKMPPIKRKRVQSSSSYGRGRPKTSASSHNPVVAPPHKKCERFTNNMCIRTDDYPLEQIMGSIRRHKNAMSALLAEFYDKPNNNLEFGDEFDDYIVNKKRREDEGSAGGMCQSVVRYARPQKAKAASGEWKYIVNTGQHTQTLRLEKCSNPGESCSYLAQTYRSHCSQVYNYHRLLSWDKVRGLHVDIFKVPTCCSCQVDGYRQQFPPLSSIQAKDYSPGSYKVNSNNGYSTINDEDLDYNDESDEDELGLSYAPINSRDNNELSYLGSKKVRSKLPAPSSVGPYLSPPDDDEDAFSAGSYKSHKSHSSSSSISGLSSSSKKYYNQLSRRRPQQHNEARVDVDLDLSPSETQAEQEVNVFGPPLAGEQQRVPLKRKRIYSSTHTHTAGAASPSVGSGLPAATARVRIPLSQSQGTAATSSLPGRTGTAATATAAATGATGSATVGVSISAAAHAHQAVASSGPAASSNIAFGSTQQRYYTGGIGKSRPRYYAPITTTPPAAPAPVATPASQPATPLPTTYYKQQKQQQQQQQREQSTAFPQPSHVNSIYGETGSNSGGSSGGSGNGTRRINYNYHPIIDFFEKNRRAEAAATAAVTPSQVHDSDYEVEESRRVEQRYPHRISSSIATPPSMGMGVYQHAIPTSHERRIGFGAGAGGGGGAGAGVGVAGGSFGFAANDNAWQPLVVEP